MSISAREIAWVAKLSRLELTPDELATYSEQLRSIVDYIDLLKEVDTTGVEPLAHPIPVQNVFRDDVATPSLPVEEALRNAPERKGDFFGVPAVLD
jgi:aspartyl-tRNA(Asn)/glutamyl-tRNA(Gln) amidotransferase subunit C